MIPRRIPTRAEAGDCPQWHFPWGISWELAFRLMVMADQADPLPLMIISGFRSQDEQAGLAASGRPAAPDALSTHRTCPATGADLSLPSLEPVNDTTRAMFGRWATFSGLRWGGGSPVSDVGIPTDWTPVDLGPRADPVAMAYRAALQPA